RGAPNRDLSVRELQRQEWISNSVSEAGVQSLFTAFSFKHTHTHTRTHTHTHTLDHDHPTHTSPQTTRPSLLFGKMQPLARPPPPLHTHTHTHTHHTHHTPHTTHH